jgi:polyisoprenoid-binding protein YceI
MEKPMKKMILASFALASLTLHAADLSFDRAHSGISFSIPHMVVSRTKGTFTEFDGSLSVVDGKLTAAKAVIQVKSIDTQNKNRDDHLRNPDFFDIATYPEIRFVSTKVLDGKLVGNLTIRDVTREVTLDTEFLGPVKDPAGKNRYGLNATTTIDRTHFGLTWSKPMEAGGLVVGNDVQISISVEVIE